MGFGQDYNHPASPPAAAFAALLHFPPPPALCSLEEQGYHREADRQTFRGGVGWGNYGVGDGKVRMEFADRMGRLREELAIGMGIGKKMLSDGEREEPGAVAWTTTRRRRDNDDNDDNDDNNDTK